jgi:hypothetical protein
MDVLVLSKLGQGMSRLFSGSSLLGEGMLVRLRSSTIGILGIVAAVGLSLIAFISQQGWPGSVNEPLPQSPPRFLQNDTLVAPFAVVSRSGGRAVGRRDRGGERRAPAADPPPSSGYELTSARQVGAAPVDSEPVAPQPDAQPQPAPAPPTNPAPANPPPPPASQPVSIPVVAAVDGDDDDDSPGRSGESRGRSSRGSGPPPWAGHGGYDDDQDDGDRDYDDDDQYEYDDDDDDDDDEYDGHHGHGRPDWAGH